MGTSTGYEAPTTPQWRDLKGKVTRLSGSNSISSSEIGKVINGLINALGGASKISAGSADRIVGASAVIAGRNLSSFINSVAYQGFEKTLENRGLEHLKEEKAKNIIYSLVDELCGDGSSIDEVDVRNAMYDLEMEILKEANSYEEVDDILNAKLTEDSLDKILFSFFGYYLFHIFERIFSERISQKKGNDASNKLLDKVKTYIIEELEYQTTDIKLSKVDWQSDEGKRIIESVLQQTLLVFGE